MHIETPEIRTARANATQNDMPPPRESSTPFVDAFIREFVQPQAMGAFIWPSSNDPGTISKEFGAFLEALLLAQRLRKLPLATGDVFRDRVASFLDEQRWPAQAKLPEAWRNEPKAGNYAEISLVCQALLTGLLNKDGGGHESQIPPHGP